jgi:tRNA threonylcarbamoyladenosine biosynthesis protein TsaE
VSSPTFALINEYQRSGGETIYHMDWYRVKDEDEAIQAGIEDCLYSGNLCLVEWPEKAPGILPDDTVHIHLETTGINTRRLTINQ